MGNTSSQPPSCFAIIDKLASVDLAFEQQWLWKSYHMEKPAHGTSLLGDAGTPMAEVFWAILENALNVDTSCLLTTTSNDLPTYWQIWLEDTARDTMEAQIYRDTEPSLTPEHKAVITKNIAADMLIMNSMITRGMVLEVQKRDRRPKSGAEISSITVPEEALRKCKIAAVIFMITDGKDPHDTVILIDTANKTVEWFDSNGFENAYYPALPITRVLRSWLSKQPHLTGYHLKTPSQICIRDNFSIQEGTGGTCAAWASFMMLLRLSCPQHPIEDILTAINRHPIVQRQRIIRNWIYYTVQIYRFHIKQKPKPVTPYYYTIDASLPFAPLLTSVPVLLPDEDDDDDNDTAKAAATPKSRKKLAKRVQK